jgi:hypothetical protein
MDNLIRIPGVNWRVGLDPFIGLIPGVGDLVSTFVSLYVILAAVQYGAPKITILRMGLNIGIDLLVGAIPFLGDFFDVVWRANDRNVRLLRSRMNAYGSERRQAQASDWAFVLLVVGIVLGILALSLAITWFLLSTIVGAIRG